MKPTARIAIEYAGFRLRRRFGRVAPLESVASHTWELAPPETRLNGPAICLPGQFDKVIAFNTNTRPAIERVRVYGGRVDYPAVQARRFERAVLFDGAVHCGRGEKRIRPIGRAAPADVPPATYIAEGVLTSSYLGQLYFGHWLRDDLGMMMMAEGLGEPFMLPTAAWPHIQGYRRLLNMPCRELENAVFESLIVFDDEELTPHKASRLAEMRRRVAGGGSNTAARGVFILRGWKDRGARRFVNEGEVAETLAREGFVIIDPMTASVDDIARMMRGARIVIGAEGSQLCHAVLWLAEGGSLLAVTSPTNFTTSHKRWTDLLGAKYGIVVGDPCTDEGFQADVNDILRTADLLQASGAEACAV